MRLNRRENPFSPKNAKATERIIANEQKARAKRQARLSSYTPEIIVTINPETELPFKIVHAGDTHLGHDSSLPDALGKAVKETGQCDLLVTHANIIESFTPKFPTTNIIHTPLTLSEQEALAKNILRPIDEQGRLVPVGANSCHEGWSYATSTHDPLGNIVSSETRILFSGGQLAIKDQEGESLAKLELYHKAGSGQTQLSPEGSARARSREVPIGHPDRPDAVIVAHMHRLTASQDVQHDPISRTDVVTTLGMVGTAKATKEKPDNFLISIGVPPREQGAETGHGLVTIWRKNDEGKLSGYPVAGYPRAKILFSAEKLWENAQRTNNLTELIDTIKDDQLFPAPEPIFDETSSETRHEDYAARSEGKAPLYKTISHKLETSLPVRIQFIGGLRVGSTSLEREKVEDILLDINSNSWAYFVATRRLINKGTPLRVDREDTLGDMAELLSQAKSSLLGVMLTDELRSKAWSVPRRIAGQIISDSMYPGDWLYYNSPLSGVPLIMSETVQKISLGKTNYTFYLRDQLSHFSSLINPFHGLTRVQQVWGINCDALIGGHTEVVGWRTWVRPWGQLEVVVPGGFSEFIEKGIGNRVDYPTGGQGIIVFPNKKLLYSFATPKDGHDMHEALWLQSGLDQMGRLKETRKKLEKKRMT